MLLEHLTSLGNNFLILPTDWKVLSACECIWKLLLFVDFFFFNCCIVAMEESEMFPSDSAHTAPSAAISFQKMFWPFPWGWAWHWLLLSMFPCSQPTPLSETPSQHDCSLFFCLFSSFFFFPFISSVVDNKVQVVIWLRERELCGYL